MGSCHETRADRTRSIIDEDYRIKQEMIRNLYYNSRVQQEFVPNPYEERRIHYYPMQNFLNAPKTIVNNEKIISKNRSVLTDVYKLEKQVGEGGYGQVFLVRHKKMNLLRAMKVIPINSKNEQEKTDEEIELLKQLDHPNIVKLFEYFSDSDKYYLITEYCKGGDLFDLIKVKKRFSELSSAYIMYQIFLALFYCHKTNHLIHRDIKPENIVVVRKNKIGEELYDVKLIDFGISKIFNKVEANSDIRVKGSLNYIAPEVLKHKYNEKCDIWSCGVILYILVMGTYPFNGKDKNEILNNIKEGNYSFTTAFIEHSSSEIRDLIHQCLLVNPSSRISAKKALNHPFFKLYEIKEFFNNVNEAFLNKTINNIKNYKINNSLQELTFTYLVHNYPNQEEIALLYRVFNKLDLNNDGKMTKEELKIGLLKYLFKDQVNKDVAEKEIDEIFNKLDRNKNGYIECEEFVRAGIDKKLLKNKKALRFTFDFLDKNKNGEVSVEELKEVFGANTERDEKALVDLIKSIDTDCNGQISFDEFYSMIMRIINGLI
jgi:calcium-dependent protein kinase